MTEQVWLAVAMVGSALVAAIPPTIAAMAARRVSEAALKRTEATEAAAERAAALAADTLQQSRAIHLAVNSNLTAVKADLVIANNRIADLLALIAARGMNGPP